MKISSIITNNTKCGANFVHYLLSSTRAPDWKIISLRGDKNKLYDLNIKNFMKSRMYLLFRSGSMLKELESELEDINVVVSDGLISYYYANRLSKKYPNKKYYALVHNDYTIDNRTNWNVLPNVMFNFLYDKLLKNLTIITTSKSAYTSLIKRGLSVVAIDNGVIKPISSNTYSNGNIIEYWFIGRLTKVKQVDLLVKSFSILPNYCRLNIVGDGDQRDLIINLCDNLGIHYKYWGQKENPFSSVSKGDIFVLPSLVEGRSIALMEAMLSGCCCIVSNIDANMEFSPYGAITFDVLSELDLSTKLNFVSGLNVKERSNITNVSQAERDFSVNKMVEQYIELFNE